MELTTRRPHDPRLDGLVRVIWRCRAPAASGYERVLPSGSMQLIVNLHEDSLRHAAPGDGAAFHASTGTVIQGMHARAFVLDRVDQRDVLGVVFEPGAARVMLETPLDAFANAHVELDGSRGVALRCALLEAQSGAACFDRMEHWLAARIRGEVDPLVGAALARMQEGEARIRVLASTLGASERALRRRFHAEVGLPPKTMVRVLRLQRALHGLRTNRAIADVAASCGFHDQAHLAHELSDFGGPSPRQYRLRRPVFRNHVD